MSLLTHQGYEHDIAISYAHFDNRIIDKQWVSSFHSKLYDRLISFDTRIKIWRDERISGNEYFDLTLKEIFTSTGLLISCVSRNYIKSEYCQQEISYFYTQIQEKNDHFGLLINNKSRLFNILVYDLPREEWPEPLTGREGYCFYDDLGFPLSVDHPTFDRQIKILAKDIWELLSYMYRGKPRKEIFFANSPPNVESYRETLEDELRLRFRLRPDEPLPIIENLHREQVSNILKRACGSIHLFGRNSDDKTPGNIFWDTNKECSICQAEEALNSPAPQFIWYPSSSGTTERMIQCEQEFIITLTNAMKNGELNLGTVNKELAIIEGSPSNICCEVRRWVDKLNEQEVENNFWLVDAKPGEHLEKFKLKKAIENNALQVLNYQRSDDLLDALKKCCRYILVIKDSPATSIGRLQEVVKQIQQIANMYKVGIFISKEGKPLFESQKEILRSFEENEVIIYDENANGFNSINSMTYFIEKLK